MKQAKLCSPPPHVFGKPDKSISSLTSEKVETPFVVERSAGIDKPVGIDEFAGMAESASTDDSAELETGDESNWSLTPENSLEPINMESSNILTGTQHNLENVVPDAKSTTKFTLFDVFTT